MSPSRLMLNPQSLSKPDSHHLHMYVGGYSHYMSLWHITYIQSFHIQQTFANIPLAHQTWRKPILNPTIYHPWKEKNEKVLKSDTLSGNVHILSYVQGLLWDSGFHNLDHVMVNAQAARQYKIYPRSLSIPDAGRATVWYTKTTEGISPTRGVGQYYDCWFNTVQFMWITQHKSFWKF